MGAVERIVAMLERTPPSELLLPLAHSATRYFLDNGTLGAVFEAALLPGADERTQTNLTSVLNEQYPPGTMLQFIQMGVPDVTEPCQPYEAARSRDGNPASETARALAGKRVEFIKGGTKVPHLRMNDALTLDARLYVTIQIPFSGIPYPSEEDLADFSSYCEKLQGTLDAAKIATQALEPASFLAVLRRYFRMFGTWDYHYDEETFLRKQVVPPGTRIVPYRKMLRISVPGEPHTFVRTVAVNRFPKWADLGLANALGGDPDGNGTQIGLPYALCTTLHIPEQSTKISKVRASATLINNQAFGPMLKWVPVLKAKKEGHDCLGAALERRQQAIEVGTTLTLFSRRHKHLERRAAQIASYYSELQAQAFGEQYLTVPTFFNQLPLQASPASISKTHRFKTMGAEHGAQFLPVLSDWGGYGDAILLHTRRMRPFRYDFFDSRYNSNFSWLLFAEAGAGKSFTVERFLSDYLSMGVQLWVVDKGRSHTKLTQAAGGQVIEFNRDSAICLNPFTRVADFEEDVGMLTALVCKMAAPRNSVSDAEETRILEAITSTWQALGPDMMIENVIEYLRKQTGDPISIELSRRLYPFSRSGPYGSWFNGRNNFEVNAPIVTLELKGLEANPILQEVVLLQLMLTVEQQMFRGDETRQKMMIAEECGDLLKIDAFAKFVAAMTSKIRKHKGSMGIVMQNLTQLYQSRYGAEIAASCATKLIMQQTGEAIELARTNKWLDLPDAAFDLLKTVHTKKGRDGYSEIAFYSPVGLGIARLVESRFNQILFSSEGRERTEILDAVDRGENVIEAVDRFIAEEAEA
ncbi:TraC family protein [Burkholderia sp. MBR-1]|uniref:TraC family protein n=1 Tax=Burkholderia sp. MBR-1 TaxID=2732364 RepID=UPI0015EF64E4|nr:TraC family protein [Burkholderia sp. MBR-1]QMI49775.1 TraC family protein [Burkholderia sp. MBR-1]